MVEADSGKFPIRRNRLSSVQSVGVFTPHAICFSAIEPSTLIENRPNVFQRTHENRGPRIYKQLSLWYVSISYIATQSYRTVMVRERRAPRIHPGCTLVCKCDASLCLEAEEVDYITLIVLRTGYSVYVSLTWQIWLASQEERADSTKRGKSD